VLWTTTFEATQPSLNWPGAPVAFGGRVYSVGSYQTQIVAEATGAEIAAVATDGSPWSIPAANSRGVFVNLPANDAQLVSPTGTVLWVDHTGSGGLGGPAAVLHGTQAWIRTGYLRGDGEVVDQATGKVLRSFDSDTPPAFAGSYGVLSDLGTLTGINAATGATLWSEAGDAFLDSPPVIAGTTAYVTSRLGVVYGFDIATGVQTWQAPLPSAGGYSDTTYGNTAFDTALTIGDGYLAVPSGGDTLTVFGG
jgi:outer membrane protein assembly factor BamB